MMSRLSQILMPILLVLALSAFQVVSGVKPKPDQPADERAAQSALPQSKNSLWGKLTRCAVGYDQTKGLYSITVTPEVKSMNGQTISANGFILPLDGSDKTKHFLLTKRTPVCLFCPPGEPNEVIEVHSKSAMDWKDDLVTMTGTFKLVNDGEKGVFFALDNAEPGH